MKLMKFLEDKQAFKTCLQDMGVLKRWKKEAKKAIKVLECGYEGQKFKALGVRA